jgi:hypothetical protein
VKRRAELIRLLLCCAATFVCFADVPRDLSRVSPWDTQPGSADLLRPQAPIVVLFLQATDSYRKQVVSVGLLFDDFFGSDSFFSPQKTGDR